MQIPSITASVVPSHTNKNEAFSLRRTRFFEKLSDKSLVIIPNRNVSFRSHDLENKFKPDSDFYYLTGFEEPNSICVLKKDSGKNTFMLFVEPKNKEKEIWVGKCTGVEGAKSIYNSDESYSIHEFNEQLKKLLQTADHIYIPFGNNKDLDLKITSYMGEVKKSNRSGKKTPSDISDPRDFIHKMRLVKDAFELSEMQKAIDITKEAFQVAMSSTKPNMFEYEIEAMIDSKFRSLGGIGPAYSSIVGGGSNATTLHYINNNMQIKDNDLVLVDAGCEFNNYAADVTRTYPSNHKFSSAQKDIYQIVLEAQLKAIEEAKPQKYFMDPHNKAVETIVEGLKSLGLLKGSTQEIIDNGEYKKFYMHKTGHWLGLDVHDAGPYIDDNGNPIKLTPGMVLTVEPGIYISNELPNVPEHFKGIGIRIEDDVLVTDTGNKILTAGIPKTVREIKAIK